MKTLEGSFDGTMKGGEIGYQTGLSSGSPSTLTAPKGHQRFVVTMELRN